MSSKTKVSITLSSDLEKRIRRQSREQNIPFSALVDELLAKALQTQQQDDEARYLIPKLQVTVRKEVRKTADRLAHLLARAALDSASTKQLVFQLLVKEFGTDKAFAFRDKAGQVSIDGLRRPLDSINEILESSSTANSGGNAGEE